MKKYIALLLSVALCLSMALAPAIAEGEVPEQHVESDATAVSEEAPDTRVPDDPVVTEHSAVIQGKTVNYTATSGILPLESGGLTCEMFFTAYTVEDAPNRPLTFVFNGGPGSSSEWMHMGFLGPRRIGFDENGETDAYPAPIVDNAYSILDITDLVFIDPVGTGYSRPAEGVDLESFIGYENDIRSVSDFIRLYVNRNNRWQSPKYLVGESYGTLRAIGVCGYLSNAYGMGLNGIMLVSSINDFSVIMAGGVSDLSATLYLPTYAAIAWYHKRLAEPCQSMDLEDLLEEVRAFAGGDYAAALYKGRTLDDTEREDIATRLAAYTGLTAQDYLDANLRLYYEDFCKKLLHDQKLVVGRLDGRYTGPLTSGDMGGGDADPSNAALSNVFSTAVNQYIVGELGYQTDRYYEPLSEDINYRWDYPDFPFSAIEQKQSIYEIMSKNRFLKIWVLGGYYDLATPFFSAEWVFNHVFLNEEYEGNLQFTHYPSGHMIYLHEPSLAQFRKQAEAWYNTGSAE